MGFVILSPLDVYKRQGTGSSDSGAAASQGTEAKADAKAESKESYKIYLITMDQIDQHWVNMNLSLIHI